MNKRAISLLLALMMVLTLLPIGAMAANPEDLTYKISNGEVTITGCDPARGELIIPSTIEGYPVTIIESIAFAQSRYLTNVDIPESVISIGSSAFIGCTGLTQIKLPSRLETISSSLFRDCTSLENITIPETVTTIGDYAFHDCISLKQVTIPSSVTRIGKQAFGYCRELEEIEIKNSGLTFADDVFSECNSLKQVYYAGTKQQWIDAGGDYTGLSNNVFVHYNVSDSESHLHLVHYDPTPAHPGYDAFECSCGYCQPTSDVLYESESGVRAVLDTESLSSNDIRVDLEYIGEEFLPDNDRYKSTVRNYTGLPILHFYHSYFLETDIEGNKAEFIPNGIVIVDVPIPDDISPSSVAPYTISYQTNDSIQVSSAYYSLSEDQKIVSVLVSGHNDICIAGNPVAHVHDSETRNAKAATCTEAGYTGDEICKICGEIIKKGEIIPAKGHSWGAWTVTKPATEDAEGVETRTCSVCGETENRPMPMLAHTHTLTAVAEVPANCETAGTEAYWKCEGCGKLFSDAEGKNEIAAPVEIAALGHDPELRSAKTPTCTEPGYTGDEICKVCGEIIKKGETILANGHGWGAWTVTKPATENAEGMETRTCSVCGKTENRPIPMLAHTHILTAVEQVAATCETAGTEAYWKCESCGKLFSDAEGKNEIESPIEIAALGHDPELRNAKAPTCTEAGYTGDEICKICAKMINKGETIPAKGHNWGAWTVTKPATENAEGVETRTCSVCGESETRSIPKIVPSGPVNPFTDVKTGTYYFDPVLWAVNHTPQITNGTSANTFSPEATCTRGQVVTFLWRAMGCPEPTSAHNPFVDVKQSDYFYKAVLWAAEKNITNGTDATHFNPGGDCTRAHVVTFLWRAHEKPAASGSAPFVDVPAGQYYTDAVLWAVSKNITNGIDATHFGPDRPCQRGQIVTFLWRDLK